MRANEITSNVKAEKIFFARSTVSPKRWSYDHVGFITQSGKQIQMSGHRGNDVYVTNAVTDDPMFPEQNIKIVALSKPVSVPMTNTVGAENCGTFVANVLQANGIKGIDTTKLYNIFKQPQESITVPLEEIAPDKKTIKSLEKHYAKYDWNDQAAIHDYTGGDGGYDSNSQYLNKPLYKAKGQIPAELKDTVSLADNFVMRHRAPTNLTAYYGISKFPKLFNYGTNFINTNKSTINTPFNFINYGYTSTSLDSNVAIHFARQKPISKDNTMIEQSHVLIIKIPKGFPGAYVGHLSAQLHKNGHTWDEKELILARGTSFKILPNPKIKKEISSDSGITYFTFIWKVEVNIATK